MSMKNRCAQFNQRWGKNLRLSDIKKIYKEEKVTKTVIKSRLGRPKLKDAAI
jgi:hypothetical protein